MRSLKASVAKDSAAASFQLDDCVCSSVEKQPFVDSSVEEPMRWMVAPHPNGDASVVIVQVGVEVISGRPLNFFINAGLENHFRTLVDSGESVAGFSQLPWRDWRRSLSRGRRLKIAGRKAGAHAESLPMVLARLRQLG